MFRKSFEDVRQKRGSGRLLLLAARKYVELLKSDIGQFIIRPVSKHQIRDRHGMVALDMGGFLLVAKKHPYGDVVSVHKDVWDKAVAVDIPIIMFIESSGYFYKFNVKNIKETSENHRGDTLMVNFGIKNGVNIQKVAQMQQIVASAIEEKVEEVQNTQPLF